MKRKGHKRLCILINFSVHLFVTRKQISKGERKLSFEVTGTFIGTKKDLEDSELLDVIF